MAASRGRAGEKAARRNRSSSRRRKIVAELQAKQKNSKEAWELQQQLLSPGVNEALMNAAKQMLQPAHYEEIIEERCAEGLCGYPPCTKAATDLPERKRWVVSYSKREVHSAEEITRFCSPECRRASSCFVIGLQPEPAYIRPASAVATTREAVAESREAAREDASSKESKATAEKAVPKVRPRAVVRFSRERQTYSVQYSDYDGGGALPDVPSAAATAPVAPIAKSKDEVPQMLKAPVIEREPEPSSADLDAAKPPESEVGSSAAAPQESPEAADEEALSDGDDGDDDLFDSASADTELKKAHPFVRAWGVLSSWIDHSAKEVLRGSGMEAAPVLCDEERRPGHKGRRTLLLELLCSRMPGELSHLTRRFHDFVSCFGVHQTLPSVTEASLYDLLAALLMKGLYRADSLRDGLEPVPEHMALLTRRAEVAATALGISASELQILTEMVA